MPSTPNRRMPLSCEPCRERKIRCPRLPTGSKGPCETCIGRGIPSSDCVFLRDVCQRRQQPLQRETTSNDELIRRIDRLEALLRCQVKARNSVSPRDGQQDPINISPDSCQTSECIPNMFSPEANPAITRPETAYLSPTPTTKSVSTFRGKLIQTNTGHERYDPGPSQWSSALENDTQTSAVSPRPDTFHEESEFFLVSPATRIEDLVAILPSASHCDELINVYLNIFASLFHVLHDPTFRSEYAQFCGSVDGISFPWLALLFSVLSVAVTALDKDSVLLQDLGRAGGTAQNIAKLTARYRTAALKCLEADQYLWRQNLHTVQALIILIYGINHSHGQSWALLGLTKNIALSLGLHKDPDNFGLEIVRAEERRRCWAALNMLYMIQNAALGNMDPSHMHSDVKLPLDIDDDLLVNFGNTVSLVSDAPSQISYLLFKFRLYNICGRICRDLFSQNATPSYETIMSFDTEIASQRDMWNWKFLMDSQISKLPDHHVVHLNILFGYSHQLTLLLHRPILMAYHTSTSYTREQVDTSWRTCISSARALLGIHRMLHQNEAFKPYRWYNRGLGSFHALHGAVVIAFACTSQQNLDSDVSNELRQDLKSALTIFQEIAQSGLSRMCSKAIPALVKLILVADSSLHRKSPPATVLLPTPNHTQRYDSVSDSFNQLDFEYPTIPTVAQYQLDAFLGSLEPQQWLSPSFINWTDLDSVLVS